MNQEDITFRLLVDGTQAQAGIASVRETAKEAGGGIDRISGALETLDSKGAKDARQALGSLQFAMGGLASKGAEALNVVGDLSGVLAGGYFSIGVTATAAAVSKLVDVYEQVSQRTRDWDMATGRATPTVEEHQHALEAEKQTLEELRAKFHEAEEAVRAFGNTESGVAIQDIQLKQDIAQQKLDAIDKQLDFYRGEEQKAEERLKNATRNADNEGRARGMPAGVAHALSDLQAAQAKIAALKEEAKPAQDIIQETGKVIAKIHTSMVQHGEDGAAIARKLQRAQEEQQLDDLKARHAYEAALREMELQRLARERVLIDEERRLWEQGLQAIQLLIEMDAGERNRQYVAQQMTQNGIMVGGEHERQEVRRHYQADEFLEELNHQKKLRELWSDSGRFFAHIWNSILDEEAEAGADLAKSSFSSVVSASSNFLSTIIEADGNAQRALLEGNAQAAAEAEETKRQALAMSAAAALSGIGNELVGVGTKQVFEGVGMAIASHGVDPAGYALAGLGTAAIAAGVGMGAAGTFIGQGAQTAIAAAGNGLPTSEKGVNRGGGSSGGGSGSNDGNTYNIFYGVGESVATQGQSIDDVMRRAAKSGVGRVRRT